jgi:hypothetical protein
MQTIELALNCIKRPFRKFTIRFASDPTMKTAGFSDRIWKRWNGAPTWHRPKMVTGCCGSHGPIYDLPFKYTSIYSLVFFLFGLYSHLRLAKGIFDDIFFTILTSANQNARHASRGSGVRCASAFNTWELNLVILGAMARICAKGIGLLDSPRSGNISVHSHLITINDIPLY